MPPDFYLVQCYRIMLPLVPLAILLFRIRKIDPDYKILVFIYASAVLAEFIRFLILEQYYLKGPELVFPSHISYNIYVLIIGILYTVLFYKWGVFYNNQWVFKVVLVILPIFWIVDHFILQGNIIHVSTKNYRILYAFLLCIFSIRQINILLLTERKSLLKNARFLICTGVLLFFVPYLIQEGIYIFKPDVSDAFRKTVTNFRGISNPFCYLIFTLAVLWIPQKKKFIQL